MKFIATVTALIFAGLAAITLAPKLAFSQVLPLPDVLIQTAPQILVTPIFNGPIHHLGKAMKPSPLGRDGYAPKNITYEGDKAKQFFTLLTDGEMKDEIAFIVIIDPADADYVGDVIYVAGYLKDGTYFGQMTISRDRVAAAVEGMKAPATAEKPAA